MALNTKSVRWAGMLVVGFAPLVVGCGGAPGGEDVSASSEALESGEYGSNATNRVDAPYIGDWEHNWGYVLGYALPGTKIYAQVVTEDSVYGLIGNSGYGEWDHGHHCGWISLGGLHGSGSHNSAADVCPPPDNDFSLAHGQPSGLFRPGTVIESDGNVQPAIVLPTCSDFTVYANYDPSTHTFSDPAGVETPGRGTPGYSVAQQAWKDGYSGFGTRFITADGHAVEIKDTKRSPGNAPAGDITAFGFMHVDCIAGSQVGNPSLPALAPASSCGQLLPGEGLDPNGSVHSCNGQYEFIVQGSDGNLVEYEGSSALWASKTEGHPGDYLAMQGDGNLVLYSGSTALWDSKTNGHSGAYLAIQDDGNLVVYEGSTAIWARFGL